MHVFRFVIFGLGLVLVLGAGLAAAARHFDVDVPLALLSHDLVPDTAPAMARAAAGRPVFPASYTLTERRDLRPRLPSEFDYTPQVRDVATFRIVEGLSLRRLSLYDGGSGTAPRPVVILFHGASRDELSMIDMWDDTADAHGLLLLSLKSNGATWDPNTDERAVLARALDLVAADYPIDFSRIFVFGHSAGSIYAQMLANRLPGPWLAVAGHGGTVPDTWLEPRDAAPPVRHYLGSSDGLFPPATARQSAEALSRMGHRSELIIIPSHTHWFYVGGPAIAEDAWQWFAELAAGQAG